MGYTHYWEIKPATFDTESTRKRFRSASNTIKRFARFIKAQDLFEIRGGLGKGRPVINESEIWLNGDRKEGLDHETFCIRWNDFIGEKSDFCKTSRKPYDLLVCFALLTFKEAFRKDFEFFTDGSKEDWEEAFQIYHSFTGKTPFGLPE
jgi:hypothetical protein